MKKLKEVLQNKVAGMYYGNRILLPFKVDILKAIIENDIIMDFSDFSEDAEYEIKEDRTELYFYGYKDLSDFVTKYETIKLVVVEEGDDIFNEKSHQRIILHIKEKHTLEIEQAGENDIFIE